jgi:hypothetical protein
VRGCSLLVMLTATLIAAGCAGSGRANAPTALAATQPTTGPSTQAFFPTTAPTPSQNIVTSHNFDRLWNAAADAARDRLFTIDRRDYRGGVLTTDPLVSAQFFEPWRRDATTASDVAESSLATIRRTIRFEFKRNADQTFSVVPHVLVERYSSSERRITNAMLYRAAFRRTTATGTRETDKGVELPQRYWYRVGSDPVLERHLAEAVRKKL